MRAAVGADPGRPLVTLLEVLTKSTQWLEKRGLSDSPRLDAELLIAKALGLKRLDLYLQFDRPLAEAERDAIRPLIQARGRHEPVAYLVGEREFWSLPFQVDERVLIPRPETEHLVEVALAHLRPIDAPRFVDVGTGSGCVALSILHELPRAEAVLTDLSDDALAVAQANAEALGLAERTCLRAGDLLDALEAGDGPFDAVLSNPPYIVRGDSTVESAVDRYEPGQALYVGGRDPLALATRLAGAAREVLQPGGLLAIEVGAGSAPEAMARLVRLGYEQVSTQRDLGGHERIVHGRRSRN